MSGARVYQAGQLKQAAFVPGASLAMIEEVECPLRSAQHNRLVYDMLWSDPATPEQERGDMDEGGFGCCPAADTDTDTARETHR
eukprot:3490577-Rhodomonas_salina.3